MAIATLGFLYGREGKGITFPNGRILVDHLPLWKHHIHYLVFGGHLPCGRISPSVLLFLIKLMHNTHILNFLLVCKCTMNPTNMIVDIIVHDKYTNSISTHT